MLNFNSITNDRSLQRLVGHEHEQELVKNSTTRFKPSNSHALLLVASLLGQINEKTCVTMLLLNNVTNNVTNILQYIYSKTCMKVKISFFLTKFLLALDVHICLIVSLFF